MIYVCELHPDEHNSVYRLEGEFTDRIAAVEYFCKTNGKAAIAKIYSKDDEIGVFVNGVLTDITQSK